MTVTELLDKMTSYEISEWMAYDRTNNEEWRDTYFHSEQLKVVLSPEEQAKALKRLLSGSKT